MSIIHDGFVLLLQRQAFFVWEERTECVESFECVRVGVVIGIGIFRDFSMPELRVHEILDVGVSSQMATFFTCPGFPVSRSSPPTEIAIDSENR